MRPPAARGKARLIELAAEWESEADLLETRLGVARAEIGEGMVDYKRRIAGYFRELAAR